MLRFRQNRFSESKLHFQRAAEADPQHHLAHYYHAFSLSREQVDETQFVSEFPAAAVKTMRAALNRARELNPDFADTYKLLAFINLVLNEDLDEAASLIRRAVALAPRRDDVAYTLAQIQLRRRDYAAARQVAQPLADNSLNADIRERARLLLETIGKAEALAAQLKAEGRNEVDGSLPGGPPKPLIGPGHRFVGDQVRGFLTRIECDDAGITLTVKGTARLFTFRALWPNRPIFIRYTSEIPTSMTCGPLNPAQPVIVTYHTSAPPAFDGEPIGVEFLKPDAN